jgi:hypothetical protein
VHTSTETLRCADFAAVDHDPEDPLLNQVEPLAHVILLHHHLAGAHRLRLKRLRQPRQDKRRQGSGDGRSGQALGARGRLPLTPDRALQALQQ